MEMIDITVYEENKFIDIIIEEDLKQILKKYKEFIIWLHIDR